ncbi:amino acid ABC transporter permease [Paenibacillus silvae]|jgi:polar amino acid transport system permease protein/polar amino acid transport system substrate-binding protein|uniref:Nickel transporter n=1 Tax=Paenibacillus silvae TaxID=1325358 RepID=A0A2W6NCM5_9BACL|nr:MULTISPECIES: amino acid ABC transporter permease [Paenibacillus]MBU5353064.1 amino acid ABC transporter permease [Paenibacillus barcinonensis]MCK6076750.1 amino acid ABC transporter permease [Paenibacillus silvae]MCK6151177.1 amino acid ABC transporter permease [Paenibacillus silvae]MCK6269436.1 amino acid ABC transporter permease [Paenibacillus silvae]MDM5280818.1 amino acid ABC transporter permease [Paenibacillus silvae]
MDSSLQVILDALPLLLEGTVVTLKIVVISLIFAMVIGLISGLMSTSLNRLLRLVASLYVDIIRGTPLLVQVYFIYFGLPVFLDMRIPAMTAGIIAVSLNAGAYVSEIFRAGIESIGKGQHEAARSLGLSRFKTMWLVVLPQATRRMIPTFVNQSIITIKDTSLLSAIGIAELTQTGEIIISSNFRAFEIWGVVGIFYLIIIVLLSRASRFIERRYAIR